MLCFGIRRGVGAPLPFLEGPLVPLSLGLLLETQRAAGNSLQGLQYRQSHRPGVQQLFLGCPASLTSWAVASAVP